MKKLLSLVIALLIFVPIYGQKEGEVMVASGGDPTTTMVDSLQFILKNFSIGTVFFYNGDRNAALVNIGTLDQRVRFINEKGDTLVVVNEKDISAVIVSNRLFKKTNTGMYVEILDINKEVSLGVGRRLIFDQPKKMGAFGTASETSSVSTYSSIQDGTGNTYKLNQFLNVPYRFYVYPYLYKDEKVYTPSKKTFIKLFPDKKREIEEYLKANKVNFEKMSDIRPLFAICIAK